MPRTTSHQRARDRRQRMLERDSAECGGTSAAIALARGRIEGPTQDGHASLFKWDVDFKGDVDGPRRPRCSWPALSDFAVDADGKLVARSRAA